MARRVTPPRRREQAKSAAPRRARPPKAERAAKTINATDKLDARARTRLDVDERRAQLVELGLAEFGTRTYEEVSIDLIAQTAGISKGLLYHYFPTKRAFYLACVREAAKRLIARMDEVPDDPARPLESLRAGLDAYLEYVRGHGPAFATLMRSGVGVDREIASVIDDTRSALLSRLTSGMQDIFPDARGTVSSPLLRITLHGWIGLAEAASIAWVETCVASPETAPKASAVRDVLATALVAIVQATLA